MGPDKCIFFPLFNQPFLSPLSSHMSACISPICLPLALFTLILWHLSLYSVATNLKPLPPISLGAVVLLISPLSTKLASLSLSLSVLVAMFLTVVGCWWLVVGGGRFVTVVVVDWFFHFILYIYIFWWGGHEPWWVVTRFFYFVYIYIWFFNIILIFVYIILMYRIE